MEQRERIARAIRETVNPGTWVEWENASDDKLAKWFRAADAVLAIRASPDLIRRFESYVDVVRPKMPGSLVDDLRAACGMNTVPSP